MESPDVSSVLRRAIGYTGVLVKTLQQAIAEVEHLPAKDQEQIGRTLLLSHVEKLRALRAEIDKGLRSLDAGQGGKSSIDDFIRQKSLSGGSAQRNPLFPSDQATTVRMSSRRVAISGSGCPACRFRSCGRRV
ncbi:MAG: hypothetical protein ACRECV_17895 [Xanthobacteraceae bacterium]